MSVFTGGAFSGCRFLPLVRPQETLRFGGHKDSTEKPFRDNPSRGELIWATVLGVLEWLHFTLPR